MSSLFRYPYCFLKAQLQSKNPYFVLVIEQDEVQKLLLIKQETDWMILVCKGLANWVRYKEVSLHQGSLSYNFIVLLLGQRILFVILYWELCCIEVHEIEVPLYFPILYHFGTTVGCLLESGHLLAGGI